MSPNIKRTEVRTRARVEGLQDASILVLRIPTFHDRVESLEVKSGQAPKSLCLVMYRMRVLDDKAAFAV
jgi:hypothetical protein